MAYLVSAVISQIRTVTEHDVDLQVTDTQFVPLIDSEYQRIRRQLGDLVPDLYTKVTADFTLGAGITAQDLSAAPTSITDLGKLRSVEIKDGTFYRAVPLAAFIAEGIAGYLCWRQRGATTIDFFPVELVSGQTFRAKYVSQPASVTATSDSLDIPAGADGIIVERVAARGVRNRFEEDANPHLQQAAALWQELRESLSMFYNGTPQTVEDISGRY
jgi:hypothetical protein